MRPYRMASWLFYLLVVLVALCLIALGVLAHAGFFSDLRIRTSIPASLPKRVAYCLYTGPYKQAGSAYGRICGLAPNRTSFALYYDDPKEVSWTVDHLPGGYGQVTFLPGSSLCVISEALLPD